VQNDCSHGSHRPGEQRRRHELTFWGFRGLPGLLFWGSAAPVVGSWEPELSAASSPRPLMVPAAAAPPPFLPVKKKKRRKAGKKEKVQETQKVWIL